MGLLDYFDPDRLKAGLQGLLGKAPIVKALHGEKGRSFRQALLDMPIGDAEGAYEAALNIGPMMLGKIVYHGSPHKFDKFDASKIGTGEGAQAYGHGVYLADAEGVAKEYAAANAGRAAAKSGFLDSLPQGTQVDVMKILDQKHRGPLARAQLERVKDRLSADQYAAVLREFDAGGALYKADLPDEWIPKMLDWDKPLSEQPEFVRGALGKLQETYRASEGQAGPYISPDASGRQVIEELTRMAKWQKSANAKYNPSQRATEELRFLGIPGIRYLDGGSRGKGQGSYNYVVFPGLEDQVKILERNGVPLTGLLAP